MQIRFLQLDPNRIFLLGYELKLSPTEEILLRAVAEGGKCGTDDLAKLLSDGVNRTNVSVHINSINRKAKRISSRKLIVYESKQYRINNFM